MPRFALAFAIALCSSPMATVVRADEAVRLEYKFGPKDEVIYRSTVSLEQKQTVNGMEIVTKVDNTSIDVRTLEKVDEKGQLEIKSENKRINVAIEIGPLGKYEFDSTETEHEKGSTLGSALTPLYETLSGAYLWTTISPRGEVVSTRGYAELVKGVIEENPLAGQFAAGGTDEGHRSAEAQLYPVMPEKPIAVGDEWEGTFDIALPKIGKFDGKTVSKLEKVTKEDGHDIAEISLRTELSIDISLEQGGAKVTGSLSTSKSTGRIRFDVTAGKVLLREDSYTISGNLNVDVANMMLNIPMEQTQSVKIEALDELPK